MKKTNKNIKPRCRLVGTDGNAFNVIGKVSSALKKADMHDEAKSFLSKAYTCSSYHELLVLCTEVCDVR